MKYKDFSLLCLILTTSFSGFAGDVSVQTLSEGACWYEEGEFLKLASFNDKESIVTHREDIDAQIEKLMNIKNQSKVKGSDFALHCGSYGASIVVKTEINHRASCVWLKMSKGKLAVRSVGGLEPLKGNELCDGYKWGELLVGVKNPEQVSALESEVFQGMIKSVVAVSENAVKVVLKEEFHGKEVFAVEEIKKQVDLRYIELNLYQHPNGEAVSLK